MSATWQIAVTLVKTMINRAEERAEAETGHKHWDTWLEPEGISLSAFNVFGESRETNFRIKDIFYKIEDLARDDE